MHFRCTSCAKVNREQVSLEKSIMFIMCIQCTTLHSRSILVTPVTKVPVNLLLFNAMSLSHYLHNVTVWIQIPVRVHYLHWSCTSIRLNHIWKMQSFLLPSLDFWQKLLTYTICSIVCHVTWVVCAVNQCIAPHTTVAHYWENHWSIRLWKMRTHHRCTPKKHLTTKRCIATTMSFSLVIN